MEIRVAGHQMDTGDALRRHVADRLGAIADRYFQRGVGANVTFGKGPHDQVSCDIVAPVSQGIVLKASNRAADAHVAFDGAAEKIERQLQRYRHRLRERRFEAPVEPAEDATYTILRDLDEPPASEAPPIIAETRVDIPDADVAEAVMTLDLRNTNALMFRNRKSGQFNMVYRRGDGTIGWVEPLSA